MIIKEERRTKSKSYENKRSKNSIDLLADPGRKGTLHVFERVRMLEDEGFIIHSLQVIQ